MSMDEKVASFMTPREKLDRGAAWTPRLKEANDIIWDNKINSLPIMDDKDRPDVHGVPQGLRLPQGQTR